MFNTLEWLATWTWYDDPQKKVRKYNNLTWASLHYRREYEYNKDDDLILNYIVFPILKKFLIHCIKYNEYINIVHYSVCCMSDDAFPKMPLVLR